MSKQSEPQTHSESSLTQDNQKTVRYRNKDCSRADIEDLLTKHKKREPTYPDPDDCCGQGCEPCIYDTYDQ